MELLENLNHAVQSSSKWVASMIAAMQMTVDALNQLWDDYKFETIYANAVA